MELTINTISNLKEETKSKLMREFCQLIIEYNNKKSIQSMLSNIIKKGAEIELRALDQFDTTSTIYKRCKYEINQIVSYILKTNGFESFTQLFCNWDTNDSLALIEDNQALLVKLSMKYLAINLLVTYDLLDIQGII